MVPACLQWTVEEVADWIDKLGYKEYRVHKPTMLRTKKFNIPAGPLAWGMRVVNCLHRPVGGGRGGCPPFRLKLILVCKVVSLGQSPTEFKASLDLRSLATH